MLCGSTGGVALPILGTKTNYWPKNWVSRTIFKVFAGNRHFPVLAVDPAVSVVYTIVENTMCQ